MCGFAALIEPGRNFSPALLAGIEADLRHRGPDSGGRLAEPGRALVFRRLAILDPGPAADQPMSDPNGRCTLVYNGEIYNYRLLRAELEQRGAIFRTTGDTEVLLQAYLTWGEAFLDRLEGMYAFCILDRKRNLVLAARDPFGIKPLYLMRQRGCVALASEMRPFARLAPPQADEVALAELLTFGWAAGRLSNLAGIERVPGGTVITVPLDGGAPHQRRFADPLETLATDGRTSAGEAEERVHEAIGASAAAHLASDVGYTVQLSGGVDSSLIAALTQRHTGGRLASYAVQLRDHPYDEGEYRAAVVERYGLDHHEVPLTGRDYADALPRAVRHMEGPPPHGACVTLMLLCDRARARSKVVLTGEGADEFFGGYQRYGLWRKLMWQERLGRRLPAESLPNIWPFAGMRRNAGRDAAVYASVYHDFHLLDRLFPELVPGPGAREAASRRFRDFRDRLFAVDQTAYLESLLVRQDKMSMAASVEARVPYVHLPLARIVNALPRRCVAPGGETKPLLKAVAERYLPTTLVRRRKIGLWLPYHDWFRDREGLGRYLSDLTGPGARLAQYADRRRLTSIVDELAAAGTRHAGLALLRLVTVELWLRSLAEPASAAAAAQ